MDTRLDAIQDHKRANKISKNKMQKTEQYRHF